MNNVVATAKGEGWKAGMEHGMEKGMEKVALNCMKQGMSFGVISQITGLTVEDIEKLK